MQKALNIVQCYCRAEELSVCPDKMELLLFTERKKVDRFIEPVLQSGVICATGSVKYLRAILDAKLPCREHVSLLFLWLCC
jgi:hypothetical protein